MVINMSLEQLLRQCRFPKRYKGYYALKKCLQITLEDEESLLYMTGIYERAGKECNSSWRQVERNIRNLLEYSWRNGGRKALERISGCVLYARPTVGEMLEALTCYIKEHPEIKWKCD